MDGVPNRTSYELHLPLQVRAWFSTDWYQPGRCAPGLFERLSDCAPQHSLELPVELGACLLRQRVPLPRPRERVRERTDAYREQGRASETATPRLEIRVAQPREPRVGRRQLVDLLEGWATEASPQSRTRSRSPCG